VTGKDSLGASPGVTFTIDPPTISLSQSSGYVGDSLTVSGSGFKSDAGITVYFDSASVGSFTADAAGSFSKVSVTVPLPSGENILSPLKIASVLLLGRNSILCRCDGERGAGC